MPILNGPEEGPDRRGEGEGAVRSREVGGKGVHLHIIHFLTRQSDGTRNRQHHF